MENSRLGDEIAIHIGWSITNRSDCYYRLQVTDHTAMKNIETGMNLFLPILCKYNNKTCGEPYYTTFTIFSMKYLVMCKVYTDVGGIK